MFTDNQADSIVKQVCRISKRRSLRDNLPIGAKVTREMLGTLFAELGFNKGAEIGVKQGVFSRVLCDANPNIELYCIDAWPMIEKHNRNYTMAKNRLASFNATLIRKPSMDAVKDFEDGALDFVYIDANHSFNYVCPDIIFWADKVRSGGIVAGHDYFNHFHGGVVKAVDAYTHCNCISPWYVTVEKEPSWFWVKK